MTEVLEVARFMLIWHANISSTACASSNDSHPYKQLSQWSFFLFFLLFVISPLMGNIWSDLVTNLASNCKQMDKEFCDNQFG